MKLKLNDIEAYLQSIIEGSALRFFPSSNQFRDLGEQLVLALKTGARPEADGEILAPDLFTVIAHPSYFKKLHNLNGWQDILLHTIKSTAEVESYTFLSDPIIQWVEDGTLSPQKVEVASQISIEKITSTTSLDLSSLESENDFPADAFFILNGTQTYPLVNAVINIGRRPDNDLVLDDSRVSRLHAQIRAIKGHYVIFDLDSTGGTFVNGKKIRQYTLSPGDVVSFAGLSIVYGQEPNFMSHTDRWVSDAPSFPTH